MDFSELIIHTFAKWGQDCIECADTLNRYSQIIDGEKIPCRITLCTAVTLKPPSNEREILLSYLREHTTRICFYDLEYLAEIVNAVGIDNPVVIIDKIWDECNNVYNYWGLWFDEYKERLLNLL